MSTFIVVMGNLGGDPEERTTGSGEKIISFNVASNRRRGGADETTWFRITVFGNRFDKMLPYLKKGSSVIVSGELAVRDYTDRDGNQRKSIEVIADRLSFSPFGRRDDQGQGQGQQQNYNNNAMSGVAQGAAPAATPAAPAHDYNQQAQGFGLGADFGQAAEPAQNTGFANPAQPQQAADPFAPFPGNGGNESADPFAGAGSNQMGGSQEDNLPF